MQISSSPVCLSFGNLICGAALLFVTLLSVLLPPQIHIPGQPTQARSRFRSDSTPSPRRCRCNPIHVLSTRLTCSHRALIPVPYKAFLLACHYYNSYCSSCERICYPYPVFVDTYPFCRVKLELFESEHEIGKAIYTGISTYPCALGWGESYGPKKQYLAVVLRHESIGVPSTVMGTEPSVEF